MPDKKTFSGAVAILGSPNTGKSTLLNRILGKKISIVSDKPQTTRQGVRGIYTRGDRQIIFVDTPGIGKPIGGRHARINLVAEDAKYSSDIIVWILDAKKGVGENDRKILSDLENTGRPVIAVFNKMDLAGNGRVLPLVAELSKNPCLKEFFPISAKTGENVEKLVETLLSLLPENPFLYGADETTDQEDRTVVAEFIREQIFINLERELPYRSEVEIESFDDLGEEGILGRAAVLAAEARHRKILIGTGGAAIKNIRKNAERRLKKYFGRPVRLELWVKVVKEKKI
jgi:GTP-binding protein Era